MTQKILVLLSVLFMTACASKDVVQNIEDLPPTASGSTSATVEFWSNVSGKAVRSLTRNWRFPNKFNTSEPVSAVDYFDSKGDKYGQRIVGHLEVQVDGPYTFFLSADESAELWLSTDDKAVNKQLIAIVNKPSGYKVFDRFRSQKSRSLSLKKGSHYYIEIIHKDYIGEDYLNVSWAGPDFDMTTLTSANLKGFKEATNPVNNEAVYQEGYHAGYESGRYLSPYDLTYPSPDSDSDGLPDFYERIIGLNVNDPSDALTDLDGDLLSAVDEYLLRTNPNDADSDSDGLPDGFEVIQNMDPSNTNDAYGDLDGDGVSNIDEYNAGSLLTDANSIPAPTTNSIVLTWEVPKTRGDGTALSIDEIQEYRVYAGESNSQQDLKEVIKDSSVTSASLVVDKSIVYFSISTVTTDGLESERSNTISIVN